MKNTRSLALFVSIAILNALSFTQSFCPYPCFKIENDKIHSEAVESCQECMNDTVLDLCDKFKLRTEEKYSYLDNTCNDENCSNRHILECPFVDPTSTELLSKYKLENFDDLNKEQLLFNGKIIGKCTMQNQQACLCYHKPTLARTLKDPQYKDIPTKEMPWIKPWKEWALSEAAEAEKKGQLSLPDASVPENSQPKGNPKKYLEQYIVVSK